MLRKYLTTSCFCSRWLICCNLLLLLQLLLASHAQLLGDQIDKSIDLFATNLNQKTEFKLKCKFNHTTSVASHDETLQQASFVDQDELDYSNLSSHDISSSDQVDWYKMNESGNYYVKLKPKESNIYQVEYLNKYTSSLKLKQDYKSIQGLYLCKLKSSQHNLTKHNSQFIQKVSVNEISNSIDQFLDYKLLQINSSRILVEFNISEVKKELIYSLINLNTTVPILYGKLATSNTSKTYLVLEGLTPKSKYSLVLKPLVVNSNQLAQSAVSNITIETRGKTNKSKFTSAFDLIQSIAKKKDDETPTEYDGEDEEEDDEYTDDYYEDEYNSFDQAAYKSNDRITNCEISPLTNIATLDYSSLKMNKLLNSVFKNNSIDISHTTSLVSTFKDFFNIVQFNQDKLDYSIYNQCIHEYRQQAKLIQSKPLCLFNLDRLWYVKSQDLFSVHSSVNVSNTLVYVASTCIRYKRTSDVTHLIQASSNMNSMRKQLMTQEVVKPNEVHQQNVSITKLARLFEPRPLTVAFCRLNHNYLTFGLNHLADAHIHFVNYRQSIPDGLIYSIEIKLANDTKLATNFSMNKKNNSLQIIRIDFPNNSIAQSRSNNRATIYLTYKTYTKSNSTILNVSDNEEIKQNCTMSSANTSVYSNITANSGFTNSKLSLIIAALSAIILLMASLLICVIVKRKYGLSSDYLFNLKNNLLFKSRNDSTDNNNTIHSSILNFKKPKHSSAYTTVQQPQYQLPSSNFTNSTAISSVQNTEMMSKNPTFNYVRYLKQKWHNNNRNNSTTNSSLAKSYFKPFKRSFSLNSSNNYRSRFSSKNNSNKEKNKSAKMSTGFIRAFFINLTNDAQKSSETHMSCLPIHSTSTSSASSSASSSPLVLMISDNLKQQHLSDNLKTDNNSTNQVKNDSTNAISYYSSNFTNSIKSKLNSFKFNSLVYKVDNEAISSDLFDAYVQRMHVDGDFGFAQLYEEISNATRAYSYSSEVSLLDYNRCKNRYSNILTYDHSRVRLSHDEKDETGGYINANYVDGYQKQNAYIATQGPMPNTFGDFWRMIWEKNCSIVIMITNVKEKGRIKCDQYWPDEGFEIYGSIQVTHLHTITLAFYTKRIFTIKIKNAKKRAHTERLVYQYHFTDWPDHGVPYYIMPVLTFIKKSSRANPELGGPIVVHCSAGVGRTGTYIVIDAMMNQIKHKNTVNIHSFLKHIRHQRNYLVQTEEQFIFIYDSILEWIKSGETELSEHNYKSYLNGLLRVLNDDGLKLIDKQFELITDFKPKDYHVSAGQMPFNLNKNRSLLILPVNNSRVVLAKKPGVEGSEYINASYLHGSCRQDEFIITQYPLEETKNSFWQMVWDNNSNQIVVLNADDTEHCDFYWMPIGECMKCESFTVILKEENFDMDFVLRDFLLQSIDEDYEFHCRMISACYWPDSCAPLKTAFDLINKVRYYRSLTNLNISQNAAHTPLISPPLIVHDLCGGARAATFCALYTFQDLIQLESSINVYELAKMYHQKRPGIWTNRTNIMFLYEAAECLFDELHLNNQFNQSKVNNIESLFNQSQQLQQQQFHNHPIVTSNNNNNNKLPSSSQTNTLPNISNYLLSNQPNSQLTQPQRHHSNDAIGSRIQTFQKQRDDLLDPLSAIPLTNPNSKPDHLNIMLLNSSVINDLEAIAIDTNITTTTTNKTSFISDIPKMLPSFLTTHTNKTSSNETNTKRSSFIKNFNRRSSGASSISSKKATNGLNNINGSNCNPNRAIKFMNTVLNKSVSFKRALFSQLDSQQQHQQQQAQEQQTTCQLEPKPSMMIALASASSSSSSGSSTTVVQTTTESSLSSKSANLAQGNSSSSSVSPNSVNNLNENNNGNTKTNAISSTNLNGSICSINTPTTTITQLNKTTSQSNLKL